MLIAILTALVTLIIGMIGGYITFTLMARPKDLGGVSKFHNIRVCSPDGGILPTHVYIDGKEIHGVTSLDYHISIDEKPTVTIKGFASGIEASAISETMSDSVIINIKALRKAFLTDRELYKALVASIEGALRESTIVWEEWEYTETAEKVADRIIGIS